MRYSRERARESISIRMASRTSDILFLPPPLCCFCTANIFMGFLRALVSPARTCTQVYIYIHTHVWLSAVAAWSCEEAFPQKLIDARVAEMARRIKSSRACIYACSHMHTFLSVIAQYWRLIAHRTRAYGSVFYM